MSWIGGYTFERLSRTSGNGKQNYDSELEYLDGQQTVSTGCLEIDDWCSCKMG